MSVQQVKELIEITCCSVVAGKLFHVDSSLCDHKSPAGGDLAVLLEQICVGELKSSTVKACSGDGLPGDLAALALQDLHILGKHFGLDLVLDGSDFSLDLRFQIAQFFQLCYLCVQFVDTHRSFSFLI